MQTEATKCLRLNFINLNTYVNLKIYKTDRTLLYRRKFPDFHIEFHIEVEKIVDSTGTRTATPLSSSP
jgi:hypothetical protein